MAERGPGVHHVEHVMGTVFTFDVRDEATPQLRAAVEEAVDWLHHVDAVYSPYRPQSAISRLARGELTPGQEPAEVSEVLALCEEANARTEGRFDARAGGALDPCGLVKGWAVEEAARLLERTGARNYAVNGGGDIRLRGAAAPGRPWTVGVADPRVAGGLIASVAPGEGGVATSGPAERGAHVLDPRTGQPARTLLSATVVGPSLTWSDVYATAAVVHGTAALPWMADIEGYELLVVTADGTVLATGGFPHGRAAAG
ncbi:FAD:protein FMN transferase [Streptomyces sp. NPDC059740]|uniref:FAD:protein FMN transferase n=1 Tax=Streptomyces sp. NPDC059740 TaxID=3346926 RepID=UPI003656BED7